MLFHKNLVIAFNEKHTCREVFSFLEDSFLKNSENEEYKKPYQKTKFGKKV